MLIARRNLMAANSEGVIVKVIVYDGQPIANTEQFYDWVIEKLGGPGWFLMAKNLIQPKTNNQVIGGVLPRSNIWYERNVGALRYKNGIDKNGIEQCYWSASYDAFCSVGDEYYCMKIPEDALY